MPVSAHLHVVEIYVEGREWLGESFVPARHSAESLSGVRLHGVIRLRAAAHWAPELPGCRYGQVAHLRHTDPEGETNSDLAIGPDTLCCRSETFTTDSGGLTCDACGSRCSREPCQTRWLRRG